MTMQQQFTPYLSTDVPSKRNCGANSPLIFRFEREKSGSNYKFTMVMLNQNYFSQIGNNYNAISNGIECIHFKVLIDLLHQLDEAVPIAISHMMSWIFTQS